MLEKLKSTIHPGRSAQPTAAEVAEREVEPGLPHIHYSQSGEGWSPFSQMKVTELPWTLALGRLAFSQIKVTDSLLLYH